MNIDLSTVTPAKLGALELALRDLVYDGIKIENLDEEKNISGVIAFLHHVKHNTKHILRALEKAKMISEVVNSNETRIQSIAKNDQLETLFDIRKERAEGDSKIFSQYIYAVYGIPDWNIKYVLTRSYNKFKRRIMSKLARIKTNKDVLQLAQKHPDIDIPRLVSYGVVSDKIDYTKDDLIWLDKMIDIIKQGNK